MAVMSRKGGAQPGPPYPRTVLTNVTFAALEQAGSQWRVLATGLSTPRCARDAVGSLLWAEASRLAQAPGTDARRQHQEFLTAAGLLDWEDRDDVTAGGRRFRIARVKEQARTGPGGPGLALPGDTCPRAAGGGDPDYDPARGIMIAGTMRETPPAQDQDPNSEAYPLVAKLPRRFAPAESRSADLWWTLADSVATEQAARDVLVRHLTHLAQVMARNEPLDDHLGASFADAAATLRQHPGQATVARRTFRVILVEPVIRFGPGGPEPPDPRDGALPLPDFQEPGDRWPPDPDSPPPGTF